MDGYHLNNGLPHYSTSQSTSAESTTLPPISGMQIPYQNVYGQAPSLPHTPLTPHTPLPSVSSAPQNSHTYPQLSHPGPPRTLQPQPSHQQQQHQPTASSYTTQSILSPSSASLTASQSYPFGPVVSRPTDLLPRPPDGITLPHYPQQLASQPNALPKQTEPEPTHVVGQQGRRGILPSAPGRPAPTTGKPVIPIKDADGKFPCPNCTKTYLHAKHLKRHMLRHTGDRPYQCKLCKDTFSRSDILKRHFQKCSIRRGTPGDTDHLEGARLHQNKNRLSTGSSSDQSYLNGVATQGTGFDPNNMNNHLVGGLPGFPISDPPVYAEGLPPLSNRTSRSSSIMQPTSSTAESRRSVTGLEHLTPRPFDASAEFGGTTISGGLSHGIPAYAMPQLHPLGGHQYGYPVTTTAAELSAGHHIKSDGSHDTIFPRSNQATVNGQQQSLGWNGSYQPNNVEGFANNMSTGGSAEESVFSGLYSNSSNFADNQMFDGWDIGDPLEHKAKQLVTFCYPHGTAHTPNEQSHEDKLKTVLTADNVKLFIMHFSHFHGHWPIIHMPTFNPSETYDGLLLAICTIGAIYSDKLSLLEARWLMELVQNAIQRALDARRGCTVEEIQALIMLQIVFTWHGDDIQRQDSRQSFWKLVELARNNHLLRPLPPSHPGYSVLHNGRHEPDQNETTTWSWHTWVEQEKRSRAMYLIYLLDCALVLYFNERPQLDAAELRIQLPCDDAVWQARNSEDCAKALGLRGPEAQTLANSTGSRRLKQPQFRACLETLLDRTHTFGPRSTNVYSKFILIHAIHVQIWLTHHQNASTMATANPNALPGSQSGPTTPLGEYDWVARYGSTSNSTSGHVTPTDGVSGPLAFSQRYSISTLQAATNKWKDIWDRDIELQYPSTPTTPTTKHIRRIGFCRDGIHFFYLAKIFLNQSGSEQTRMNPDQRFAWVFKLLKNVRRMVGEQSYKMGKEIGSVFKIAEEYGVEDLTLNMKLLFAPLEDDEAAASGVKLESLLH